MSQGHAKGPFAAHSMHKGDNTIAHTDAQRHRRRAPQKCTHAQSTEGATLGTHEQHEPDCT
eukprot:4577463-Pleurochrysis_carterae.AAC.4